MISPAFPRGLPRGRVIDLSHPIRPSMPVYPTDPRPALVPWTRAALHGYDSEVLHMGTHTGTHMDAPSHFLQASTSIDAVPLDRCIAPGVLLDLRWARPRALIGRAALERAEAALGRSIAAGEGVLLWTGWSDLWRDPQYLTEHPGLSGEGAQFLLMRRVALVGVDTMSVDCPGGSSGDPESAAFPAHRALLAAGVPIVENLTLLAALAGSGPFTFAAFPMPVVGASGSPVRAVAILHETI